MNESSSLILSHFLDSWTTLSMDVLSPHLSLPVTPDLLRRCPLFLFVEFVPYSTFSLLSHMLGKFELVLLVLTRSRSILVPFSSVPFRIWCLSLRWAGTRDALSLWSVRLFLSIPPSSGVWWLWLWGYLCLPSSQGWVLLPLLSTCLWPVEWSLCPWDTISSRGLDVSLGIPKEWPVLDGWSSTLQCPQVTETHDHRQWCIITRPVPNCTFPVENGKLLIGRITSLDSTPPLVRPKFMTERLTYYNLKWVIHQLREVWTKNFQSSPVKKMTLKKMTLKWQGRGETHGNHLVWMGIRLRNRWDLPMRRVRNKSDPQH